jgi:hypothetical protein
MIMFRTVKSNSVHVISGIAIAFALCVVPATFAQQPTTQPSSLVDSQGEKEIRSSWYRYVESGQSLTVNQPKANATNNSMLIIDNVSLQVYSNTDQTYFVQIYVSPFGGGTPAVYRFLLSTTATWNTYNSWRLGTLNQPTRIYVNPGDTLTVTFNGNLTWPAGVSGTISGSQAPGFTSLPL